MGITVEQVRATVEAGWEDRSIPDAIEEYARRKDGKPFSVRDLENLPGGESAWRIRKTAGMTNLETTKYALSQGNEGFSFLIAYATTGVMWSRAFLVSHNKAYYEASVERNKLRLEAKNGGNLCKAMAETLTRIQKAKLELQAAEEQFEALTEHGEPFHPDRNALESLTMTDS